MLLDPRHFRLDDLLRRPLHTPLYWGHQSICITLQVEREPLLPADGHERPSHQSVYARHPDSGLQVVQDAFTTSDGTEVVSFLLRNPSAEAVFVELGVQWAKAQGPSATGWVHRCAPPLDDCLTQIPPDACFQRTFTLAHGSTEEQAWKRATPWFFSSAPAAAQARQLDDWRTENAPLFDCSDPWLTRLVAFSQVAHWQGITLEQPPINTLPQSYFPHQNFDAPPKPLFAWEELVRERLVGVRFDGDQLTLTPDNFLDLPYFCLQGLRNTTIVWDDPASPHDAYDDGDKGLTVYVGRWRVYNQQDLAPTSLSLQR